MRPFIIRYAVSPDKNLACLMYDYDPEREVSISRGMPVIEDRIETLALTGSFITMADRDPTHDEATDR
jgi:hypothetical protein